MAGFAGFVSGAVCGVIGTLVLTAAVAVGAYQTAHSDTPEGRAIRGKVTELTVKHVRENPSSLWDALFGGK